MLSLTQDRANQLLENPADAVCIHCQSILYQGEEICPECDGFRPVTGWPNIGSDRVDHWLGKVIGNKYLVTGYIDKGNFAQVYRVLSRNIPRSYAAKVITADVFREDYKREWVVRTQREVTTMMRANNPHIVSLHDVLSLGGSSVCLIMDLIEGVTLDQYASDQSMDLELALKITEQIALAIRSIHKLDVLHRDIKPENIMISELGANEPFVTLLDLGLVSGDQRVTNGFVGTALFSSPEICAGGLDADVRSDIYSIASVMFYLLTGQTPFKPGTIFDVIHRKLSQDAPLVSTLRAVPDDLDLFVARLLNRDKTERPIDIDSFLFHLRMIKDSIANNTNKPRRFRTWIESANVLIASASSGSINPALMHFKQSYDKRIVVAQDATSLRHYCEQTQFDLILIDAKLPGARDLRSFQYLRSQNLPYIVILSQNTGDDVLDMLELMGTSYLLPPLNGALIDHTIQQLLFLSKS